MRLVVKFEGQGVGVIEPAGFDHFEVFGPWQARECDAAPRFVDLVEGEAEPRVELASATGQLRGGYVTSLAEDEITVKCVPASCR